MRHSIFWEMNTHGPPSSDQSTIVSVTQYEWPHFVHLTDAFLVTEYEKVGGNWMWLFKRRHNPQLNLLSPLPEHSCITSQDCSLAQGKAIFYFCYYCSGWEYIDLLTYFAFSLLHYSFRPGESFSQVPRWSNKMSKLFWDSPLIPFKAEHFLLFLKIGTRIFQNLKNSASVQTGRPISWQ